MRLGPRPLSRSAVVVVVVLLAGSCLPRPVPASDEFWIVRDTYGVPHIYADTATGLFRGQGYAVAQDRLWQMDVYARTGRGTLAELLGWDYVPRDRDARREGYTTAELDSQYLALPPETRAIIEAYTEGVNDRVSEVRADLAHLLPFEYGQIGQIPAYWTPQDVLAAVRFVGRSFGSYGGKELFMQDELNRLGPGLFDLTYPINDPVAQTTIRPGDTDRAAPGAAAAAVRPGDPRTAAHSGAASRYGHPVSRRALQAMREQGEDQRRIQQQLALPTKLGSYGVAVGSTGSTSGFGLLLGAPQTGTPDTLHAQFGVEVDLHGAGFEVSGMAAPGVPGVIIGRNDSLSWTLTGGKSDNLDTYVELVESAHAGCYFYQGEWVPFETRTDTIHVRGGGAVLETVHRSVHGPVLIIDYGAEQAPAMKRTYWAQEHQLLEAMLDIDRAADLDEFRAALEQNPFSFNALAASRSGEIGYWHTGRFAVRAEGVDPRLPQRGTGEEEWQGVRPFADLPQARYPAEGYFANWNNKPVAWWDNGDNVPWVGWHHVQLIYDLLDPFPTIGFAELQLVPEAIHSRGTYEQVADLRPSMVAGINILPPGQSGFIAPDATPDPHFKDQYAAYMAWGWKSWIFDPVHTGVAEPAWTGDAQSSLPLDLLASPRPAGREVDLLFRLAAGCRLAGAIYDVSGRRVRDLVEGVLPPGFHRLRWDGRDERGEPVPGGVYFARLAAPGTAETVKVVLSP